ncbi:MAG: hypothetical protein KDD64_04345 [Bdellovibrionales bacterium]|nr:hypothetical protein [Bdellovibrionales bacterium]
MIKLDGLQSSLAPYGTQKSHRRIKKEKQKTSLASAITLEKDKRNSHEQQNENLASGDEHLPGQEEELGGDKPSVNLVV